MAQRDAKARIVEATIQLIERGEEAEGITMRRIASRARVGIGLINYHFRTKEELIDESVRIAIARVIARWDASVGGAPRTPAGKLRVMLKATARFLVEHPRLSRISIENDLRKPRPDDNTSATVSGLLPVLREIFGARAPEQELRVAALQLVAPLQVAFLRGAESRALVGAALDDEEERSLLVDKLVDQVVRGRARRSR